MGARPLPFIEPRRNAQLMAAMRGISHHFSAFEKGFSLFIIESFCPALALER